MDKNQAVGLLLMSILLAAYFWFFSGSPQQPVDQLEQAQTEQTDQTDEAEEAAEPVAEENDSTRRQRLQSEYGALATAMEGQEAETVLENELVKITLSNRGGSIRSVQLKKYATWDDQPLMLVTPESSSMDLTISLNGKNVNLRELYFQAEESDTLQNGIAFTLNTGGGKTITQVYSLPEDSYVLKYSLVGTGANALGNAPMQLVWNDKLPRLEQRVEESRLKMKVNYLTADGDHEDFGENNKDEDITEVLEEPVKWIALKQKFFTSAIIAENAFAGNGQVELIADPGSEDIVKTARVALTYPAANLDRPVNLDFYYGPNNYQVLKKVTEDFSENVDLGWGIISWFNKFLIIPIFQFLEDYIASYGIIIIILVVIIKLLLLPLSYKSYISMAKTKVLKPQLDKLKEKFGDDMQKMQQEQMKLYRQVGINPVSGCVPMLLQLPILLAMFNFFPNSIELRQEPFLWANDLSTYDALIQLPFEIPLFGSHISLFALLMTVSTLLYTYTNQQMSAVQGPMKNIGYIMPVVFFFVLNSFAAGLTFYYFVSNVVTMAQQPLFRRFVDDEKIKRILEENKKKAGTRKKSGFQARLEDAMKKAEEARKQQDDRKKKR